MQSQCSICLKGKNNKDLLISFLKFNDGASDFNNGAENLMMEHFNLTMEHLHHKIPQGDPWSHYRYIFQDQVLDSLDPELCDPDVIQDPVDDIDDLIDELENLSDSGPEIDMDTVSVISTPKPRLR